jgi:hypothetical protein
MFERSRAPCQAFRIPLITGYKTWMVKHLKGYELSKQPKMEQ